MFKIGEFSKLTQVSIRMLRYYDETGLLKPAKTDPFTNYRLYASEQITTLNRIIFLRDLGFQVSEIADALGHWGDAYITQQLEAKRLEIESAIKAQQDRLAKIDLATKDIKQHKISINYSVSIKSIPSYQVLSLRRVVPDYYAEGTLWQELSAFATKHGIAASSDTFAIYHDADYRESNVDIEICAPVATMGHIIGDYRYRITDPVPIMASTMIHGEFKNIAGAYLAFADWLQAHHQYEMTGPTRQIVHRGPWNETDANKYLTEIQIPLKEL